MADITSADVAATMTIEELFPNGFALEQFSADSGITADAVQEAEAEMTIDGVLVAGFTPAPKTVTITLQASSPSVPYLRTLVQAQNSNRRLYHINLTVRIRATGETRQFNNGYLTSTPPMPGIGKKLQPLAYGFTFESAE